MPNETITPQDTKNAPQADETTPRVEEAVEHSKANEEAKRYRLKAKELKSQLEENSRMRLQAEEARDQAQAETRELRQAVEDLKYRTLVQQIKSMNALFEQGAVPRVHDPAIALRDKVNYSQLIIQDEALNAWLEYVDNLSEIKIKGRNNLTIDELLEVDPIDLNLAITDYIYARHRYMMKVIAPARSLGDNFTVREQTRTHALKSNLGDVYTMLDRTGRYF